MAATESPVTGPVAGDHAMHVVFGLLALGFVVALVISWYHGEDDRQRVSGPELLFIARVLAVDRVVVWQFGQPWLVLPGCRGDRQLPRLAAHLRDADRPRSLASLRGERPPVAAGCA